MADVPLEEIKSEGKTVKKWLNANSFFAKILKGQKFKGLKIERFNAKMKKKDKKKLSQMSAEIIFSFSIEWV